MLTNALQGQNALLDCPAVAVAVAAATAAAAAAPHTAVRSNTYTLAQCAAAVHMNTRDASCKPAAGCHGQQL